jgi:hypothetical protein
MIDPLIQSTKAPKVVGNQKWLVQARSKRLEVYQEAWMGGGGLGRRPGVGCGRGGRRRMAALVGGRAAVRLLGSASLRRGDVGRRGASSRAGLFWAKCSGSDVTPMAPICHLPPADAGVCTSRPSAICGRMTQESVLRAEATARPTTPHTHPPPPHPSHPTTQLLHAAYTFLRNHLLIHPSPAWPAL